MKPLTANQCKVINYLWDFYTQNDQLPPNHTISQHFGWSSDNAALETQQYLRNKGLLEKNSLGKWKFTALARQHLTLGHYIPPDRPARVIERALSQLSKAQVTPYAPPRWPA